jgi:hypothetical protein
MSFAQALSFYVALNLLVAVAFGAHFLFRPWQKFWAFGTVLRFHYVSLALVLGLGALQPFLPRSQFFEPPAKVWSAPTVKAYSERQAISSAGYIGIAGAGQGALPVSQAFSLWGGLAVILLAAGTLKLIWDFRRLAAIRRAGIPLRRLGAVSIYLHDHIGIPFSVWLPGRAYVFVPSAFLFRNFRIAVLHELQHHRQRDTLWVYVLWALRLACPLNPAAYWWSRRVTALQEFACDEALLGRKRVSAEAYARCLFETAESAFRRKRGPACATGLSLPGERFLTKRRMETMLYPIKKKKSGMLAALFCASLAALLVGTAYAASSLVQDRRVSLDQAKAMAEKAAVGSEFPIVVNDLVLAELNRFVGTPEGREFVRASLQRMENYRELVGGKVREYRLPPELAAVPFIESGYQNLPERNQQGWGAGIWMFIQSTARNFGLRVDEAKDERLNAALLTDAAMRYLKSNYLRFRDWQLAALAYNMGEGNVQKAISATGSRDAWVLIRKGYEGDKNYLARLMAAVILLKNPSVVE